MLLIQKFGGTSVGTIERIEHAASIIIKARNAGHDVVVVVSAMAGETDRLIQLAQQITATPETRELAVLMATGEQVSMSLLSILLNHKGYPTISYTGMQAKVLTDSHYTKARILSIDNSVLKHDLAAGKIVIVAGFQGYDARGNITTLGRGGSDTSAVALAASLKADECQIFTDVDGVYTTDPKVVPEARRLSRITFEEMLELSSLGAKVLQIRAVEFAGKYNVPLRVLSSFEEGEGTLITYEDKAVENPIVSGVAFSRTEAKVSILGVSDKPGVASYILGAVSKHGIEIDMIIQNIADKGKTDFTFTIPRDDYNQTLEILEHVSRELSAGEIIGDAKIAKLSIVGVGMRNHAGVANTMFKALADEGINIQLISTSEIKISVVVEEKYLELGVRALHTAFKLDVAPTTTYDSAIADAEYLEA